MFFITIEERQQIVDMRLKGFGYKAIAASLNKSRDTIKKYCKNNNLFGVRDIVKLNHEIFIQSDSICLMCSIPLSQKVRGRAKKFCSDECRYRWWKENPDKRNKKDTAVYIYTCIACGKQFNSYGNKNRKFCCHVCYINYRFGGQEKWNLRSSK